MLIQLSVPRSGSTLIWNITKDIFPNNLIKKEHQLNKIDLINNKYVVTIRDPRDSLASVLMVNELTINKENIINMFKNHLEKPLNDLINLIDIIQQKEVNNLLILQYELFFNDFDYIFNKLELFFKITVDQDKRQNIIKKYNINEVDKIAKKYKKFSNYNRQNHIHGRHISSYKGRPSTWLEVIPEGNHSLVNSITEKYIKKLNNFILNRY